MERAGAATGTVNAGPDYDTHYENPTPEELGVEDGEAVQAVTDER